jgi:dolichol-phosphate mannosyltransferase
MTNATTADRDVELKAQPVAPAVSVVIPCYNEEQGLPELYNRLHKVLHEQVPDSYEIVLVDDGSRDGTWQAIIEIGKSDPRVVAAKLSGNRGHQVALTAGLKLASGERILILDADLQDPPELLAQMMSMMDDGADVVYGQRRSRAGETWFKKKSASMFYRLLDRIAEVHIPRDTGDFRLMSRRALDFLLQMPERQRFVRGMVAWVGLDQRPLLYDRDPRFAGSSHYPFGKMMMLAMSGITSFSVMPLRIASAMGLIVSFIALLLLVYSLSSWIFLDTVSGWTSLMTGMLALSGVQLLVLGIIGEYIGRVFVEVKDRPPFFIEAVVRKGKVDLAGNTMSE